MKKFEDLMSIKNEIENISAREAEEKLPWTFAKMLH